MTASVYIETDSAAPRRMKRQYGYVLECTIDGKTITREGFGQIDDTMNAATLTVLAMALERFYKPSEITVYMRDSYVRNMLASNIFRWHETGFRGADGKLLKHSELWQQVYNAMTPHTVHYMGGFHAYTQWLQTEMKRRKNEQGNTDGTPDKGSGSKIHGGRQPDGDRELHACGGQTDPAGQ